MFDTRRLSTARAACASDPPTLGSCSMARSQNPTPAYLYVNGFEPTPAYTVIYDVVEIG
jgi:hypothetical protein